MVCTLCGRKQKTDGKTDALLLLIVALFVGMCATRVWGEGSTPIATFDSMGEVVLLSP